MNTQKAAAEAGDQRDFDVEVCREGFGFATIKVRAASAYQADQQALDEAGNHLFNEKSSRYSLVNPHPPEVQAPAGPPRELDLLMEVSDYDGYLCGYPVLATRMTVTQKGLARIVALSQWCKEQGISEVRYFYGAGWIFKAGREDESWPECVEVSIDSESFHITGLIKHSDTHVVGATQYIAPLVQAFEAGVTKLANCIRNDPFSLFEDAGLPLEEFRPSTTVEIHGPDGQVSAEDFDAYASAPVSAPSLAERG